MCPSYLKLLNTFTEVLVLIHCLNFMFQKKMYLTLTVNCVLTRNTFIERSKFEIETMNQHQDLGKSIKQLQVTGTHIVACL
jgi:hypothetical protein